MASERMILTKQARKAYERWSIHFGRICARVGLTPNLLTALSVLAAGLAAALFAWNHFYLGLAAALASCGFDVLDGATARATGTESAAGTVLDRAADRASEALFLLGFLLSGRVEPWIVFASFFGLIFPSYVRAVAESVGGLRDCEVGFAGRLEKLVIVFAAAGLEPLFPTQKPLTWGLLLALILSLTTAFQRLAHAARPGPDSQREPAE